MIDMIGLKVALHETAQGLHSAGGLDAATMHDIRTICLPPIKQFTAQQIRRLRRENEVSQAVFAAYLNMNPSTVRRWESGQQSPNGPSLKLLNLVDQKGLNILG